MRKELIGLDHLMISTPDLPAIRACYQRLGFSVTPMRTNEPMGGGRTGGRGGNHLVLFRPTDDRMTNFLEFAYADPAHAVPYMRDLLGRRPALAMIVHAATDLRALDAGWQAAGFPPCMYYELDTDYRDPEDGTVDRIHFRVLVPDAPRGPLTFNACEVMDRSHYLRPGWIAHENGAEYWAAATVATGDLPAMRAHFAAIYGIDPAPEGPVSVTMGDQSLSAVTPASFAATYGDAARRADGSAAELAVELRIASAERARAVLSRNGVAFQDAGRRLIVPATEAGGIVLVLAEAG
ncbi:VOC family protein [uncultured Tistrella sp.]|uniref:VOC family protein n=1 Tax=Tistrella mobilis TaxID=171437 RepID=UPI000C0B0765|nr:VOC family protein [uncultured Tistrella sp.]MAM74687.1 hypothetical protein [Tistrella sp.]